MAVLTNFNPPGPTRHQIRWLDQATVRSQPCVYGQEVRRDNAQDLIQASMAYASQAPRAPMHEHGSPIACLAFFSRHIAPDSKLLPSIVSRAGSAPQTRSSTSIRSRIEEAKKNVLQSAKHEPDRDRLGSEDCLFFFCKMVWRHCLTTEAQYLSPHSVTGCQKKNKKQKNKHQNLPST